MANLTNEQLSDIERCLIAVRDNPGAFPLTYAVLMYAEIQRSRTPKKLYLLRINGFQAFIRADDDVEARALLKRDGRHWTERQTQVLICAERGEIFELVSEGESAIILAMETK